MIDRRLDRTRRPPVRAIGERRQLARLRTPIYRTAFDHDALPGSWSALSGLTVDLSGAGVTLTGATNWERGLRGESYAAYQADNAWVEFDLDVGTVAGTANVWGGVGFAAQGGSIHLTQQAPFGLFLNGGNDSGQYEQGVGGQHPDWGAIHRYITVRIATAASGGARYLVTDSGTGEVLQDTNTFSAARTTASPLVPFITDLNAGGALRALAVRYGSDA